VEESSTILFIQNERLGGKGKEDEVGRPTAGKVDRFGGLGSRRSACRPMDVGEHTRSGEVAAASAMTSRQRRGVRCGSRTSGQSRVSLAPASYPTCS